MHKLLYALLALAVSAVASGQDDFSSLEERMTGKEFEAAGLDKLSDEELSRLNEWIRRNVAGKTADDVRLRQQIRREVESEVQAEQKAEESGEREEIVTTVPGHFTGWTGDTTFELANGQVWKQISGGSYRVSLDDPTVVIYPVSFGGWRLRLEDYGPSIGVKRVQ